MCSLSSAMGDSVRNAVIARAGWGFAGWVFAGRSFAGRDFLGRGFVGCALAACIVASACTSASDPPDTEVRIIVEDGVTIVENPGLHIADSTAWRMDTADVVRIGVVEGAPEYMIGRLAGMLRRPDGTILVADAIAHEIRVFDERGRFVRKVGRAGEGPGEYGMLYSLYARGDSMAVLDNEGSRITMLGPDLEYSHRYRPRLLETSATGVMTSHSIRGFFADGQILFSDYLNVCLEQRREGGFCADSSAYYRSDGASPADASYGRFVSGRSEMFRRPGANVGIAEPHPQAFTAMHGDRFYYADAERFEVRVYGPDGSLERVIRVAADPPNLSRSELFPPMAAAPDGDERVRLAREHLAEVQRTMRLPDTQPFFSDMVVDEGGRIWLREFTRVGMPRWFIFDTDGRLRWTLRSPPAMVRQPVPWARANLQIGEDFILAAERDEYGVESVVLFRLLKH